MANTVGLPGKIWRNLLATCLALPLAFSAQQAGAISIAWDNQGQPLTLGTLDSPGASGARIWPNGGRNTIVHTIGLYDSGGTIFNGAGDFDIRDLNAFLKLTYPDTTRVAVYLRSIGGDLTSPVVKTIPLIFAEGCEPTDYTEFTDTTTRNRNVSVFLDDEAGSGIPVSCDKALPAVAGRYTPSPAIIIDFDQPLALEGIGMQFIGAGGFAAVAWELVILEFTGYDPILDRPNDPPAGQRSLVEWGLSVNTDFEGDVDPRENYDGINGGQSGNNVLLASDGLGLMRILLGYDRVDNRLFNPDPIAEPLNINLANADTTPEFRRLGGSFAEYSRMDTSPTSSSGDGVISVADWVQTLIYANSKGGSDNNGLVPVGGPLSEFDRIVRLGNRAKGIVVPRNTDVTLPIIMRSKGVERQLGFGIEYSEADLEFVRIERTAEIPASANFQLNNEVTGTSGTLGFQVTLQPNQNFPVSFRGSGTVNSNPGPDGIFDTADDVMDSKGRDITLANITFRAKTGTGPKTTSLTFKNEPFTFTAPAARNGGGIPIYTSFASAGVTIINNSDSRSLVSVVNTVIPEGAIGTVQLAIDSVGIENALGFTLNFPKNKLRLVPDPATGRAIDLGRDIPFEAFYYTNPDRDDAAALADTGSVRFLLGLQPGKSFAAGRRIIANLRFQPIAPFDVNTPIPITFTPLYDTFEVVDRNAISLEAVFAPGEVTISPANCIFEVPSTPAIFTTDGGSGSFNLTANLPGCTWAVTSPESWVTITSAPSGRGSSTITYTVDTNSGGSRIGRIEVAGKVFSINQNGCAYAVNPTGQTFSGDGGTSSFQVLSTNTCSWTAEVLRLEGAPDSTQTSWLRLSSDGFGTGSRTVTYTVDPNLGLPRSARIVVNGQSYIVNQIQCSYEIAPEGEDFAFSGGTGAFNLTTNNAICDWTAVASANWVTIITPNPTSGRGNTSVTYTVAANSGPSRSSTITIAGRIHKVSQFAATGCDMFSLTPSVAVFTNTELPLAEAAQAILVANTGSCTWKAIISPATATWVRIVEPSTGTGSATLKYTLAANPTNFTREAFLRLEGDETLQFVPTLRIIQFGRSASGETQLNFDFTTSTQGWVGASNDPGFSLDRDFQLAGEAYTPATESAVGGKLNLMAENNTNSFGYWTSPQLSWPKPLLNADSVFSASYLVSTTSTPAATVPTLRNRLSSLDFSKSDEFSIASVGTGLISPVPGGRRYTQYFTLNDVTFRAFFELLNMSADNNPMGTLGLEDFIVRQVPGATLTAEARTERTFILSQASDRSGWTTGGLTPKFVLPSFNPAGNGARGLGIKNSSVDYSFSGQATYGFWTNLTDVRLAANRLYKASFTVGARGTPGAEVNPKVVPSFRVRVNDENANMTILTNVVSSDSATRIPTFLTPQVYDVYFSVPTELVGSRLILSLDYIRQKRDFNDPQIELVLEVAKVTSVPLP